jgi:hypothetical protein
MSYFKVDALNGWPVFDLSTIVYGMIAVYKYVLRIMIMVMNTIMEIIITKKPLNFKTRL